MTQHIVEQSLTALGREDFPAGNRILLVTGGTSYTVSGAEKEIKRIFWDESCFRFSDFKTNPSIVDLDKGLHLAREQKINLVIAVGGGSPMDMAKLIKAFVKAPSAPFSYISGEEQLIEGGNIPLVAIPTTSGSGSESTHFAVVYKDKVKYSLAHPSLLPEFVVLDPKLTMSMTAYQTACSGLDALAQAIESYWCIFSTDVSRGYAGDALHLVLENLISAVERGTLDHRKAMQRGANLAGRAINISKTTGPHAFCYYLTSHYAIPHGHAAAIMLVPFIIYNSRTEDSKSLAAISDLFKIMGVDSAEEASALIISLLKQCGLKAQLSKIMDLEKEFDDFYASVNLERLKNNPRPMDKDEFFTLLENPLS